MLRCLIGAASIAALVFDAPATAQDAQPAPEAESPSRPNIVTIPAPTSRRTIWAQVEQVKTVDIPQWAKDEGHNGSAAYNATVGADGKLIALKLISSSGSEAIDEAVRQRAEQLTYGPARDAEGNPAQGYVNIRMSYARFDEDSPGGGIDTYTCGDMVREYEWFSAANAGQPRLFRPKQVFLMLGTRARMARGEDVEVASMDADIERRLGLWDKLVKRCANAPGQLFLDVVPDDESDLYRTVADEF